MRKINAALIGAGVIGLRRANIFGNKFKLVACADKNLNKLKKIFNEKNVFLTTDWKKILKLNNVEAVFIATYHTIQSDIIGKFLDKGINIFCEKPGGTSHLKTIQLLKKIKKKNLTIKFGYNHRYHPAFLLAQNIIKKKKIGEIIYIRAVYGHGGRKNYHKEWRFQKKSSYMVIKIAI